MEEMIFHTLQLNTSHPVKTPLEQILPNGKRLTLSFGSNLNCPLNF